MKHWIIAKNKTTNQYLIPTEKAIWIAEQPKEVNIQEIISENKNLGTVTKIPYAELKEVVLNPSTLGMEFHFVDEQKSKKRITLPKQKYKKIGDYFKKNLQITALNTYSLWKQISSRLFALILTTVFSMATYLAARAQENGEITYPSEESTWLRKIIVAIAHFLGTTGLIIVSAIVITALVVFLVNKIQNQKREEILILRKNAKLFV